MAARVDPWQTKPVTKTASLSALLLFGALASCQREEPPTPQGGGAAAPALAPNPHNPHGDGVPTQVGGGAPITGLIKLDEGLGPDAIRPTDVLFIMARESQGNGNFGRLVAVKRVAPVELPARYELTAQDVMVVGTPFTGPFIVMARLDRDGDPMTRGEDDLYAHLVDPVNPGQEGVHLTLKKGAPKTIGAPAHGPHGGPATQPAHPPGAATQPAHPHGAIPGHSPH